MTQNPNDAPVVVSDPASELVDPDPAHDTPATPSTPVEALGYEHPGFIFSGANMGGQSLQTCLGCRALVQDDGIAPHRAWHERLGH